MDRSRLKSLLLGGLVALSLLLTAQLWYGQPPGLLLELQEPPAAPGFVDSGSPGEESQPVRPLLAARSRGPDEGWQGFGPGHEVLKEAWEPVAAELEGPGSWPFLEAQAGETEGLDLEEEGTWVFELPQALDLEQWAAFLGGPRYPGADGPPVRQLVVDPEGVIYWHDGDGGFFSQGGDISLPEPEPGQGQDLVAASELVDESVPVAAGLLLPADPPDLGTYSAQLLPVDPEEEARRFFADMSLVREIRERDDAAIYTDGQRALRVYPRGRVEYSFPEMEAGDEAPGLAAAWDRALTFTRRHGGWPADSLLWSVEIAPGILRFVVEGHYQGLPLRGPGPALELNVGTSGVSSFQYHRLGSISQEEPGRDVAPPQKVLETWVPAAVEQEEPPAVGRAYLALLGEETGEGRLAFSPVWWVELAGGRELIFCAFSGEVLEPPAAEPETTAEGAVP